MIITDVLNAFDNLLNESSLGRFFTVEQTKQLLQSAQRRILYRLITDYYQHGNMSFLEKELDALVTENPNTTTTVGATLQEYTLPSDYYFTLYAEYCNNGNRERKMATLFPFLGAIARTKNPFTAFNYNGTLCLNPTYYIKKTKIGFFPQPSVGGLDNYKHYYIKIPVNLVTAPVNTPLEGSESYWEVVIAYALSLAQIKDSSPEVAKSSAEAFEQMYAKLKPR